MRYRIAVRLVAWALRHGVSRQQVEADLAQVHPWRDGWAHDVIDSALAHNWIRSLG